MAPKRSNSFINVDDHCKYIRSTDSSCTSSSYHHHQQQHHQKNHHRHFHLSSQQQAQALEVLQHRSHPFDCEHSIEEEVHIINEASDVGIGETDNKSQHHLCSSSERDDNVVSNDECDGIGSHVVDHGDQINAQVPDVRYNDSKKSLHCKVDAFEMKIHKDADDGSVLTFSELSSHQCESEEYADFEGEEEEEDEEDYEEEEEYASSTYEYEDECDFDEEYDDDEYEDEDEDAEEDVNQEEEDEEDNALEVEEDADGLEIEVEDDDVDDKCNANNDYVANRVYESVDDPQKCHNHVKEEDDRVDLSVSLDGIFPVDVYLLIAAHLPLPDITRLRLLSRSWNQLIGSRLILGTLSHPQDRHTGSESSVLVMVVMHTQSYQTTRKRFVAYWPSLGCWLQLPINYCGLPKGIASSVPFHKLIGNGFSGVPNYMSNSGLGMTSAVGLVCCCAEANTISHSVGYSQVHDYTLVIFNPFSGNYKRLHLPSHQCLKIDYLSWIMSPDHLCPGAYYIILEDEISESAYQCNICIYSSRTDSWQTLNRIPERNASMDPLIKYIDDANMFHFSAYAKHCPGYSYDLFQGVLYAFKVSSSKYTQCLVKSNVRAKTACDEHITFKWKGRLLIAQALVKMTYLEPSVVNGFVVCELIAGDSCFHWVEIARTPPQFVHVLPVNTLYNLHMSFAICGNMICMTGMEAREGNYFPILSYDLASGSWCFLPPYTGAGHCVGLFSLSPNMLADP